MEKMTYERWTQLCKQANGRTILWKHLWRKGTVTLKCLVLADPKKGISIKPLADVKRLARLRAKYTSGAYKQCLRQVSHPAYCLALFQFKNIFHNSIFQLADKKTVDMTGWLEISAKSFTCSPICPMA